MLLGLPGPLSWPGKEDPSAENHCKKDKDQVILLPPGAERVCPLLSKPS